MANQPNPASDHLVQFSNPPSNRRDLPYNQLAEQEILTSLLLNTQVWDTIAGDIEESDFGDIRHCHIFASIRDLAENGKDFSAREVGHHLENTNRLAIAGGVEYLLDLSDAVAALFGEDLRGAVAEVKAKSLLRKVYEEARQISELITKKTNRDVNQLLEEVEERITALTQTTSFDITQTHLETHLDRLEEDLEYIQEYGHSRRGIQSGFIGLDHKTNGFLKSALVVLAARPGVGKTALALNFAENLMKAENGIPVLFFSMEQPGQELLVRLLGAFSGVDQKRLTRSRLSAQEQKQIESDIATLRSVQWNRRLLIDDRSSLSVADIRKQARATQRELGGLGLIIVDYIQLMQPSGRFKEENRARELAQISSGLKQIARDFDVPVLALSQLNRESDKRTDGRPRLSDLRDSGAIEQDADVVLLLYREDIAKERETPDGKAEIIVAKNRHGETGKLNLFFNGSLTQFRSDLGTSEESSRNESSADYEMDEEDDEPI